MCPECGDRGWTIGKVHHPDCPGGGDFCSDNCPVEGQVQCETCEVCRVCRGAGDNEWADPFHDQGQPSVCTACGGLGRQKRPPSKEEVAF